MHKKFVPHPNLKGVFAGAGSDGLSEPFICNEVLRLTGKQTTPKDVTVAYLGTATYDWSMPFKRQTGWFADQGCKVISCPVALNGGEDVMMKPDLLQKVISTEADIIIVSGGNTLYAMDRWKQFGVDKMLHSAMERGCVLAGGSAGAICWFDGGHSDSMDSDTFKDAMLQQAADAEKAAAAAGGGGAAKQDESSGAPATEADKKDWPYIRVSCLGLIPGLVCPHHDKVQSNGVLRAVDFDEMVKRHSKELAICIDHWAALVVEGNDKYKVIAVPGREGSVLPDNKGWTADRTQGSPGVWLKRVVQVELPSEGSRAEAGVDAQGRAIKLQFVEPSGGKLSDLIPYESSSSSSNNSGGSGSGSTIVVDPKEEECRQMNPAS